MSPIDKAKLVAEVILSQDEEVFRELAGWGDHGVSSIGQHLLSNFAPNHVSVLLTANDMKGGSEFVCASSAKGTVADPKNIYLGVFALNMGFYQVVSEAIGQNQAMSIALDAFTHISEETQ